MRTGLRKLSFLGRKNSKDADLVDHAQPQAGVSPSLAPSSSSYAATAPVPTPTSTPSTSPSSSSSFSPLRLMAWPPRHSVSKEELEKAQLRAERDDLLAQMNIMLEADAVQRDLLQRLLAQQAQDLTDRGNEGGSNSLKLLVESSGQAAMIVQLQRENRQLRERLNNATSSSSTSSDQAADDTLAESEREKRARKKEKRRSDSLAKTKRRASASAGETPVWQQGADLNRDPDIIRPSADRVPDMKASNSGDPKLEDNKLGDSSGDAESAADISDDTKQRRFKRSRTLSFLSRGVKAVTTNRGNSEHKEGGVSIIVTPPASPITRSNGNVPIEEKQRKMSKAERRKTINVALDQDKSHLEASFSSSSHAVLLTKGALHHRAGR